VIQRSNWKIFLRTSSTPLHPSVTHQSTGRAVARVELQIEKKTERSALLPHASASPGDDREMGQLPALNYPAATASSPGTWPAAAGPGPRSIRARVAKAYGREEEGSNLTTNHPPRADLSRLSVQSPLQQLRAVRPLGVDKTLTEIWHFRLKGAPEPIYRRALAYYNLVNSPATLINADDLENLRKRSRASPPRAATG